MGSFLQTYLGLPLSNTKLRLSAFAPLIAKVDKYLVGWKVTLLSPASHVILINVVLDGLLTYAMGALVLPTRIKEALDAKRTAFLWNGSDKTTGAKCLVAWESVYKAKEDGGLGIKQLDTQNACLLLKLIHKLHNLRDSSWAAWVRTQIDLSNLSGGCLAALGSNEGVAPGIQLHISCQHGQWRAHFLLARPMDGRSIPC